MNPNTLLQRLDEIGRSLENSGHALALIGVGSVGQELGRLDEYSDLDFFAVVEDGWKQAYLADLSWLSSVCPAAFYFANTLDGYKWLFTDGIFCEFAVFETRQLQEAQFAAGRVVWKRADVPDSIGQPMRPPVLPAPRSVEWLVGEALTNLYVGLGRNRRGEKLSAMRFIQGYALDRLLELVEQIETPRLTDRDPFANERRFEQRHPTAAQAAAGWAQGYLRNPESALAILDFLEQHFEVNPALAAAIRSLAA